GVHVRLLRGAIILGHAEIARAEQPERRLRRDGRHVTALLIEPVGVALLGNAVADERGPRRAQRDQLMRIDRDVVGVLATEAGLFGAVFEEAPGHPMILTRAGQVLDGFPEVAPMQLRAALTG